MIFSGAGDVLRKLLAIIAMALLLFSCSAERDAIALVSDGGIAVYMKEGSSVRLVSSGSVKAGYIERLSGKDIEGAVSELFDIDSSQIYYVDADRYRARWQMLRRLMGATLAESPEYALWKNAKDLEKTEFMDNIDALSDSFDSELFASFPVGCEDYEEYRLERILSSAPSWSAAVDFIDRWMDSIFGDRYEE